MVNWEAGKEAFDVEQQMDLEGRSANSGKISIGGHSNLLDVHSMDSKRHPREAQTYLLHLPLVVAKRESL